MYYKARALSIESYTMKVESNQSDPTTYADDLFIHSLERMNSFCPKYVEMIKALRNLDLESTQNLSVPEIFKGHKSKIEKEIKKINSKSKEESTEKEAKESSEKEEKEEIESSDNSSKLSGKKRKLSKENDSGDDSDINTNTNNSRPPKKRQKIAIPNTKKKNVT